MRHILVLLFLMVTNYSKAQTYEIGLWLGGSNLVGDVGTTTYVKPSDPAIGGVFKWNRSNRHSFRGTLTYARMSADDAESDDRSRVLRDLSLNYNLLELSVGVEYTFWDFELYSGKQQFTPYLYTGLTGFNYELFAINNSNNTLESYGNTFEAAIPIVLGVKSNITDKLVLAAEVGARYTFTDNLDGSNPERNKKDFEDLQFGNINNNDWYIFSGITLTYTFGRTPCYCNF